MRIIDHPDEMIETARGWLAGGTVGFVLIVSNLHTAHKALLQAARKACEILVVGVFDKQQLFAGTPLSASYPQRTLTQDVQELGQSTLDILFVPRVEDLYPPSFTTFVTPSCPLAAHLDQVYYPGYTRMLATTTTKLYQLVRPDIVFLGQKDIHQLVLLRQLVRDLNIDVRIRALPTVRDRDGLAISARYQSLSAQERQAACVLYQSLLEAKALIDGGQTQALEISRTIIRRIATAPPVQLEQLTIAHPATLIPLSTIAPQTLIMIEARINGLYLTDAIIWSGDGQWLL